MRALLISIACVAAIGVCALGSVEATQLDESTGFPVRDLGNVHKGVCVTYTVGDVTTQLAVPYPNAMTYHIIGNSGGFWLYYDGSQRLRVDSLVLDRRPAAERICLRRVFGRGNALRSPTRYYRRTRLSHAGARHFLRHDPLFDCL